MIIDDRLIVALDTPDLHHAHSVMKDLKGIVSFYKIGLEFFTAHGWKAVDLVKGFGARIFLDLKLHDIPNTVARTASVICEHEVDMFNVHALGGKPMMSRAVQAVGEKTGKGKTRPILLGVTILTSHSEKDLKGDLGISKTLSAEVTHLAGMAREAGMSGVVCSPHEIDILRKKNGKDFVLVTPGVRPAGSETHDQQRVFTPDEAIRHGADYIVVGRPILKAEDMQQAARSILNQMKMGIS